MSILAYITWDVSPFIYEDGHIAIGWYGTLWTLGLTLVIISQLVIYRHEGIPVECALCKFLYLTLGLLIGARIGHCWFYEWHRVANPVHFLGMDFFYRNIYIEKPWLMFDFRNGVHGLSSHGGAFGLIAAAILLNRKFRTGIIWMFDRAIFGVCLCGACIRLGNLFNSEIYGVETTMPWGFIFVNNGDTFPSHPTQLYEMLYCLITFAILTYLYTKHDAGKYNGLLFGVFMICIFATRFGLEFIKNNQEAFEANLWLNMGQILSLPFIVWGAWLVVKSLREGKQPARIPQVSAANIDKRKSPHTILLAILLLFASCQDGTRLLNTYQGQYKVDKEIDDEFIFEDVSTDVIRSKCILFSYTSVNSRGCVDTLSAVLTLSKNCWIRKGVRGITLWNRPTITARKDCPSAMNLLAEPVLAKFSRTAVVSPDLQGFGCSRKPQCYCYASANGRAAADALFAAEKILDSLGVTNSDCRYYNIGYSQGGQTALATLPLLKNAKVETFIGEGIYDLVAYFRQAIAKDSIAIPANIPLTLVTTIEEVGANLEYEQCFASQEQIQFVSDVLSQEYTFVEMNRRIHTNRLSRILSPQICDSTTREYQQLVKALSTMSYIPFADIQQQHKIYLFHSTTDRIMPLYQSQQAENKIIESCKAKVYHRYGDYGSHDEAIMPFIRYVMTHIML